MATGAALSMDHRRKNIGWDGRSVKEMLLESERLLRETGRYWGLEELTLKKSNPILYEKIFSTLRGGLVNARETALNISASPIVFELGELCFALYTPEGDSVALSTGIIVHVHTMSDAIKWMIRNDYEIDPGIRPGDIFGNNDVLIGDVHNVDVQTIIPIFYGEELIGWAAGVIHEMDIGCITPGQGSAGSITRFTDGLTIPAQKIGENDRIYRHHELRCQLSVRTPWYWILDERTRLAGCYMVRDAVLKVIEEIGIDMYKQFIREVIEEGRRSFINKIKEMTIPGKYFAPSFTDVPWRNETQLPLRARKDTMMHAPLGIEISGDGKFKVSFDGATKWGLHSFNCSPSALQGAIWVLLTQSLIPNEKINDGAYLATEQFFPEGSWTNPQNNLVSTVFAWHFLWCAFPGFFKLLSRAYFARGYLEEVISGYGLPVNILSGEGVDQYGRYTGYGSMEQSCVGSGAGAVKDGLDYASVMWNPEGNMGEMERWETVWPMVYLGRKVKPNSGGPGKYRGGNGYETLNMVWNTDTQLISNSGEGHTFSQSGLFGGYPAASGYRRNVYRSNMKQLIEEQKPYPTCDGDPEYSQIEQMVTGEIKCDKQCLTLPEPYEEGGLYLNFMRGGPGFGDPLERDYSLIEQDLNEEQFLPRYAEKVYGAVIFKDAGGKWRVDREASDAKRREIRMERAKRAIPVKQWMEQERQRILKKEFHEAVITMYRESMELGKWWPEYFRSFWNLPEDFKF